MMETQRYIDLAREFCMFGIIGAIGFVVNIASVYIFRDAIGLYLAGLAAWFVAATVTWFLNRNWILTATKEHLCYGSGYLSSSPIFWDLSSIMLHTYALFHAVRFVQGIL